MASFGDLIEGLQILSKEKGLDAHINGADHDVIYGASADVGDQLDGVNIDAYLEEHGRYPPVQDRRLSEEENARMRELGWFIDADVQVWEHYC